MIRRYWAETVASSGRGSWSSSPGGCRRCCSTARTRRHVVAIQEADELDEVRDGFWGKRSGGHRSTPFRDAGRNLSVRCRGLPGGIRQVPGSYHWALRAIAPAKIAVAMRTGSFPCCDRDLVEAGRGGFGRTRNLGRPGIVLGSGFALMVVIGGPPLAQIIGIAMAREGENGQRS